MKESVQKTNYFLLGELIVIFILIPSSLAFDIAIWIKAALLTMSIVYVLITTIKSKTVSLKSLYEFPQESYWKHVLLRFGLLIVFTIAFMYFSEADKLFIVLRKNPVLWFSICCFYSIFSVFPQEFLYRTFFFTRYQSVFNKTYVLIIVNALVFSLAHVGFNNSLVLLITLAGGFVFAITYNKTRSLFFTSIEHAIYGAWLFTVGMGEMLAFPMTE